jgi:MarR-like DNA-binding transcriptional regulator SgrR of sgrS sRNA
LRVAFRFGQLKKEPRLVEPADIDNVSQYYFIENLSVGLVRDDIQSTSNYTGMLASQWSQVRPDHWEFTLHPDLRWSDGTEITLEELKNWLQTLAKSNSRHLSALKKLARVETEEQKRKIHLYFENATNDSVLHELSLSDAVLYKTTNGHFNSQITSGPYWVESRTQDKIVLKKNPYFRNIGDMFSEIVLTRIVEHQNYPNFIENNIDLFMLSTFTFHRRYADVFQEPYVTTLGTFSSTHYFTPSKEVNHIERIKFARAIRNFFEKKALPNSIKLETQMIPNGYLGRLEKEPTIGFAKHYPSKKSKYKIANLRAMQENLQVLFEDFSETLSKSNIAIEATEVNDADFRILDFRGNQRDPLGTWSYLFTPEKGELAAYRSLVEKDLEAAIAAQSEEERLHHLANIHRIVLEEAIAIPFMIEAPVVFHKANIDVSRWNPFDMRLRLYDVRIK